ncbi:pilus assembly PilX N-terminal domain-containing protein [Halomonas sp. NO4]|uniref:pilus assembly PilX family protein n=1 Tax=Halomonas sp. NO4 TaxID=2484813 RepID=UPI0013D1C34C|nr:pilus assembly PilX N-terminal domain-containing protein [Halomonas sp. NO4]
MKQQNGAALVVVLSMLTMSLMLGLSGMQSSLVDERLAGNYKATTEAQMVAELAVSEKIADIKDKRSLTTLDFHEVSDIESVDFKQDGDLCTASLEKASCYYVLGKSVSENVHFVKGKGVIGGVGASREVVAIIDPAGVGFLGLSPKTIPSPIDFFSPVSSQAEYDGTKEEELYGRTNAAISTMDVASAERIIDSLLGDNDDDPVVEDGVYFPPDGACKDTGGQNYRLCNYRGGIDSNISEPILRESKISGFHEFIGMVYGEANKIDSLSGELSGINFLTGRDSYVARVGGYDAEGSYVEPDSEHFSGGVEGSGILVVDGDIEFKGDPGFDGVIIVLGDYSVKGGGGSDFDGSIITSKYSRRGEDGDLGYDPVSIDISGGGGNDYRYDQASLNAAFDLLSQEAKDKWHFENEREDDTLIFEGNFIGEWYEP